MKVPTFGTGFVPEYGSSSGTTSVPGVPIWFQHLALVLCLNMEQIVVLQDDLPHGDGGVAVGAARTHEGSIVVVQELAADLGPVGGEALEVGGALVHGPDLVGARGVEGALPV